jgi:hypothetical protein
LACTTGALVIVGDDPLCLGEQIPINPAGEVDPPRIRGLAGLPIPPTPPPLVLLGLLEKNARSAIPSMLLRGTIQPSIMPLPLFLLLQLSPLTLNELMGVNPPMDWEESLELSVRIDGKSKSFLPL